LPNKKTKVQVIRYMRFRYPRFRISAVLFQFYEKHQYPIRGQILKPPAWDEPSSGLLGNVMQMISLTSKNSGTSLTLKWRLLYVFRFTRFRYKRRFAGTQSPCKTGVCTSIFIHCLFVDVSIATGTRGRQAVIRYL
jgi:hypothetical protein